MIGRRREPESHVHLPQHRGRLSQVPTGLLGVLLLLQQDSDAQMTERRKRSHLKLAGQSPRLFVESFRFTHARQTFARADVTEQSQSESLIPALSVFACVQQGGLRPLAGLGNPARSQVDFAPICHPLGATSGEVQHSHLPKRAIEQGEPLRHLPRTRQSKTKARARAWQEDIDLVRPDERQPAAQVRDCVREVALAKIRTSKTKAGRGDVKRVSELLGAREPAHTELKSVWKLSELGETPCKKSTGPGMATARPARGASGSFTLQRVDQRTDRARRLSITPERHQWQGCVIRRLALEPAISQAARDHRGSRAGLARPLVVADAVEIVTPTGRDQGRAAFVPELDCHALRFLEERAEAVNPAELRERVPQGDPNVDGFTERVVGFREAIDRLQSVLEARHRFDVGRSPEGLEACPDEMSGGLLPDAALATVDRNGMRMQVVVAGVLGLECVGDLPVKQAATWSYELGVDDTSQPLMQEIEAARHLVQDLSADELLDTGSRCRLVEPRCTAQQAELEVPPDDRPHRRELTGAIAQSVESPDDDPSYAFGERQAAGPQEWDALLERAHRLDHDEGVPLARAPDLVTNTLQRRRVVRLARERADEPEGGAMRERGHAHALDVRLALETLDGLAKNRAIR